MRARIRRNRRRSQRKLASQMGVSRSSIQTIIKEDLGLTPYKRVRKVHGLSTQQRRTSRLEISKALLQRYDFGDVKRIAFSDEKLFVIEEHLNAQNYRVCTAAFEASPERVRTVQRFQKPGSVMIWEQCPVGANFPWFLWNRGSKLMLRITGRKFLRAA